MSRYSTRGWYLHQVSTDALCIPELYSIITLLSSIHPSTHSLPHSPFISLIPLINPLIHSVHSFTHSFIQILARNSSNAMTTQTASTGTRWPTTASLTFVLLCSKVKLDGGWWCTVDQYAFVLDVTFTFAFSPQNVNRFILSPTAYTLQIWRNSHEQFLRYRVHKLLVDDQARMHTWTQAEDRITNDGTQYLHRSDGKDLSYENSVD